MQKSGFFNALMYGGEYDRKYNANDYCDNLAVIISNGVLRSENDDLKPSANGMVVTIGVGRAWIDGHYYVNDTPLSLAPIIAPAGGARYDRVFLRLNKSLAVRSVSLHYEQGELSNNPVPPTPVREGDIYDLVIADIYVGANATSVQVTDTRADAELCGWVYSVKGDNSFFETLDANFNKWFGEKKDTLSSVTLFKRYNWRTVLDTATKVVPFSIPQYDAETCFIEVFVNGILKTETAEYSITETALTFGATLVAGTEVEVKCYKSIDGTGIMDLSDEITAIQNEIAKLAVETEHTYICNGVTDNVELSKIAQEWLNGGTDYASKTVKVYGTFGAATPYAGSGTSTSPFRWLSVGKEENTNRRITFDFSNCGQISLPIEAGTYNQVFYGYNAHIISASVIINQTGTGTVAKVFSSTKGAVMAENCRFWITCYKDSMVASAGTFKNCRASVANVTTNSYCFLPFTESLLRIEGGEYYAYTGGTSLQSGIIGQSSANAVSILYGVNAPTLARSGYYQTNSLLQWVGGGILNCTDLVSELPLIVVAGISNIRGTITKSKAGLM